MSKCTETTLFSTDLNILGHLLDCFLIGFINVVEQLLKYIGQPLWRTYRDVLYTYQPAYMWHFFWGEQSLFYISMYLTFTFNP